MATHRKSMSLFPHERQRLVDEYIRRAIPVDQYETRPGELDDLTNAWNGITGRNDSPADILHYMRTQRKRGLWVKLDNCQPVPPPVKLSPEETEELIDLYRQHVSELAHGSDEIGYNPEIADLLAKEFSAQIGRIIPPHQVIAKLTALRKRGKLPLAADAPPQELDDDLGFTDIDEVG